MRRPDLAARFGGEEFVIYLSELGKDAALRVGVLASDAVLDDDGHVGDPTEVAVLLAALAVGLLIGVFQAATQIQEMTLSFIPKLLALVAALFIAGPWMIQVVLRSAKTARSSGVSMSKQTSGS